MEQSYNYDSQAPYLGDIEISPQAIEEIAILAANQIEGAYIPKDHFFRDVNSLLSQDKFKGGANLSINDETEELELNLQVFLEQGASIPLVGILIQQQIKQEILEMCDIQIDRVNIRIVGLMTPQSR